MIEYEYDEATRRLTRSFTANNNIVYDYDELGRLKNVTAAMLNGDTLATPVVTTYTYDDRQGCERQRHARHASGADGSRSRA